MLKFGIKYDHQAFEEHLFPEPLHVLLLGEGRIFASIEHISDLSLTSNALHFMFWNYGALIIK